MHRFLQSLKKTDTVFVIANTTILCFHFMKIIILYFLSKIEVTKPRERKTNSFTRTSVANSEIHVAKIFPLIICQTPVGSVASSPEGAAPGHQRLAPLATQAELKLKVKFMFSSMQTKVI